MRTGRLFGRIGEALRRRPLLLALFALLFGALPQLLGSWLLVLGVRHGWFATGEAYLAALVVYFSVAAMLYAPMVVCACLAGAAEEQLQESNLQARMIRILKATPATAVVLLINTVATEIGFVLGPAGLYWAWLLVPPGFVLMTLVAVVAPALVLERRGIAGAYRRSASLSRGFRWRILGFSLLFMSANYALLLLLALAASGAASAVSFDLKPILLAAQALSTASVGLAYSLFSVSLFLELKQARQGADGLQAAEAFS